MKNTRGVLALALSIPLTGMLLAGCSTAGAEAGSTEAGEQNKLNVVTTTNVYGQIARAIGGDQVNVTEIISSTAQDPHSYEPSARDKLTVSNAAVVLANGGGYDQFMDGLVSSLPAGQAKDVELIHAVDSSPIAAEHEAEETHAEESHEEESHEGHDHAEYNEHIWYDLDSMSALATELATELGLKDPEHAADFKTNAATFVEGISGLQEQLSTAGLKDKTFAMTEPVPFHLLEDAGMKDVTPEGLSEAVEEGEGIAPLTLKSLSDDLSAGKVDVLAYNVQTEGSETTTLRRSAEAGKVAVVDFSETITDDSTYLAWMENNINNLASTVKG